VYTGNKYEVRETDCWATGDRVCRFKAAPVAS
jgi:predicted hydrocarbon binding protein